jgi:hypothetical protein
VAEDLQVETYSGYKADERPLRFVWKERRFEVIEIADRWYGPDHEYFKVRADDGNTYILRHQTQGEQAGAWTVTSWHGSTASSADAWSK